MLDLKDQIRTYYEATTTPVGVDVFDEAIVAEESVAGAWGSSPVQEAAVSAAGKVSVWWRGPWVAAAAFAVTAVVFVAMLVGLRLVDTEVDVLGSGDDPIVVGESDPWGLGTIGLPTTQDEVTELFVAMPDAVGGLVRDGDEGGDHVAVIDYRGPDGEFISYSAQPGDSRDNVVPTEWLETMASASEYDITARSLDSSRRVVWISGSLTSLEGETIYMAGWGDPDSDWLFYVEAGSAGDRDIAVEAFIDAASR